MRSKRRFRHRSNRRGSQVEAAGSWTVEAARLLLKSLHEPLQHPCPNLVRADLILDAVLEFGVVVDLHHDEAAGRLHHQRQADAIIRCIINICGLLSVAAGLG
jgi:hypothetical protein